MSKDRDIVLASGAALGKTANSLELGTLALSGGGAHTLELGPTATMAFADSSAKTWSGNLVIKGFRENAVRFGMSAAALTDAQIRCLRTEEGRKLTLLPNGYLGFKGTTIIVR